MLTMGSHTQRDSALTKNTSFEGSSGSLPGMIIPSIKILTEPLIRVQLTTIDVSVYTDAPVERRRQRPKAFFNSGQVHPP